jgi:hypothetical protein
MVISSGYLWLRIDRYPAVLAEEFLIAAKNCRAVMTEL